MSVNKYKPSAARKGLTKSKVAGESTPTLPDFVMELQDQVKRNEYSDLAAYVCSIASTWAYADEKPFLEKMADAGWKSMGEDSRTISVVNDALLLKTTAYWLRAGNMGILCFRGTEPTQALAWLSDMSIEMDRFYTWGQVHGGFYRDLLPVWGRIESMLIAELGVNLQPPHTQGSAPVDNLLICGHSLGAALAALAAAMLYVTPTSAYARIREKLRGVYCFGQPLIGDREFCAKCEEEFGTLVFRHIYENDPITELPPRFYGEYKTFGQEYVSTSEGWTHNMERTAKQALLLLTSVVPAVAVLFLRKLPGFRRLNLSFGAYNHLPDNYINCSRLSVFPR